MLISLIFCVLLKSSPFISGGSSPSVPEYTFLIVNTYPHDYHAYTQGLVYKNGFLYESTGRRGESSLRKVDLKTGAVVKSVALDPELFGEGLAIINNRLIQLTWESYTGLVYDLESFTLVGQFYYTTEGWGLTYDGMHLIQSDGSEKLYFLDPSDFSVVREIRVYDETGSIRNINELEYIDGEVYANIMPSNRIARINPQTGKITSWLDFEGILESVKIASEVNVLNGIAYDKIDDRLFITGKLWPVVFEVKLIPKGK
jgi:glutamine cyclotransferase